MKTRNQGAMMGGAAASAGERAAQNPAATPAHAPDPRFAMDSDFEDDGGPLEAPQTSGRAAASKVAAHQAAKPAVSKAKRPVTRAARAAAAPPAAGSQPDGTPGAQHPTKKRRFTSATGGDGVAAAGAAHTVGAAASGRAPGSANKPPGPAADPDDAIEPAEADEEAAPADGAVAVDDCDVPSNGGKDGATPTEPGEAGDGGERQRAKLAQKKVLTLRKTQQVNEAAER
jgi:hypothetical protein